MARRRTRLMTSWGRRLDNWAGVPYTQMWRHQGRRACAAYARENHLFDLTRRVDTHRWMGRMEYPVDLVGDNDIKAYMPVWTSTVRQSLRYVLRHTEWPTSFVDIGCGKGKALIVAEEVLTGLRHRRRPPVHMVGVELHHGLAMTAERNMWRRTGTLGDIRVGDAADVALDDLAEPLIAFLYNPFTGPTLAAVAQQLSQRTCTVIYVNPVNPQALTDHGFQIVHSKPTWHPVATWMVLTSKITS